MGFSCANYIFFFCNFEWLMADIYCQHFLVDERWLLKIMNCQSTISLCGASELQNAFLLKSESEGCFFESKH